MAELTNQEKCLIRETWAEYCKGDMVDQGVHMFLRMFEEQPKLKYMWHIKENETTEEDFKKKPKFRFHVKRLFSTLGTVVIGMDQFDQMEGFIEDLGLRHYKLGAREEHFGLVAGGLLYALELALGNKFTPEVKAAWCKLYGKIQELMMRKMNAVDGADDSD